MDREQPLTAATNRPSSRARRVLRLVPGYVLAIGGLAWVLHDVQPSQLWAYLLPLKWQWLVLAVALDVTSYVTQGLRWHWLLRTTGRVSTLRATQAIYAGLFTNEILPMRLGEVVRAYLVSRWAQTRMLAVVPSMAVERLLDGFWLAIVAGVLIWMVPLPPALQRGAELLGITVVAGALAFLWLVLRRRPPLRQPEPGERGNLLREWLEFFADGLRRIGFSRHFLLAAGASLCLLFLQALAFWAVMPAYGLELSFWIGAAVFLIVHLGTAIPNAPANVGSYQFFCVLGLTLFGLDKTRAAGFSIVVFLVLTVPLWLLGFAALSHTGLSLKSIPGKGRFSPISEDACWQIRPNL